ncbi:F1 complex assembly factor 2 [Seminavis robusta]|uniref:F1 complex assembly factor 2 n=1 Tax=Seminavis robusta TaxID=568900 RepID=A0A9N8E4A5_9STRA|nr:F1 complex assembly factor 2 [Seminavis robusta]|eukprot:Sro604_g174160.1 F1 complex assembly factor 2 (407) ;mRNA; f:37925-39291
MMLPLLGGRRKAIGFASRTLIQHGRRSFPVGPILANTKDDHTIVTVVNRRCLSSQGSSGGQGPQPRKRFYKHVGVTEVSPPWELRLGAAATAKPGGGTVENPISAGVDGTQSASGVIGHLPEENMSPEKQASLLKDRLIPRSTTHLDNNNNTVMEEPPKQWYGVTLDGRTLRTPVGQILSVPSRLLAWAIAAEWDAQTNQIRPVQMPLMTLACTALDQTAAHPEHYQKTALQFLPTDTTCFWADPTEDRILHRRQEAAWREIHEFIENQFGVQPVKAMGAQEGVLLSRRNREKGIIGLPHPESLYDACTEWTRQLDAWHLTALNAVASETKSFLVAYAVLHPLSPFSTITSGSNDNIFKAITAARVEEEFQIESWGLVEGQHDYDRLNCSVQVRSAKLLAKSVLQQ